MTVPRGVLDRAPAIRDWAILRCWRGSMAHGMYVPPTEPTSIDDKDVLAVCVPPVSHYFGLKEMGTRGTVESFVDEFDMVAYECRKMISLLAKGNPNVLSALWLDERYVMYKTPAWDFILANRDAFVGRHVYHSFSGYAFSQLKKMENCVHNGYMGKKRKDLVDRFGFDTKNAAHLLRLLRMGFEFLQEGRLHVLREDAQELLAVKRGEWSLEKVKANSDEWFGRLRDAYASCTLPMEPNRERVSNICVEAVSMELWRRGEINPPVDVFYMPESLQ